jgi:MFS family permease
MNASIPILSVMIGAVVLLFGRKLFWLCVAAIGFAAGVTFASHLVSEPTPLLQLTFAILRGFIGAEIALCLQKLALGLAGFLAGGRLAVGLVATFLAQYASYYWLTFIIGGLIGAILLLMLFDWALIFVSSLIGAHLITSAITLPPTGEVLLFAALVLLGVLIQVALLRRTRLQA